MGRVGGDGDGRGMRKGAQEGEKSEVSRNYMYLQRLGEREMCGERRWRLSGHVHVLDVCC